MEIRLGGIYALERIANESEKDYWPIMEILTAYVRENSLYKYEIMDTICVEEEKYAKDNISHMCNENIQEYMEEGAKSQCLTDIEAICKIIAKRNVDFVAYEKIKKLLQQTPGMPLLLKLERAPYFLNLTRTKLTFINFSKAHLVGTNFIGTYILGSFFVGAYLQYAQFLGAIIVNTYFSEAYLVKADFTFAYLRRSNFEGANLSDVDFERASLSRINFKGAKNLTIDQLSKVKTLYEAQLDEGLEAELRAKGFGHLLDDEPK